MEFVLEHNAPPPDDMPDRVMLVRFKIGTAGDRNEHWQLRGNGHTWTMRMIRPYLSDVLDWLNRNGYAPVGGTDPAEFRRQ